MQYFLRSNQSSLVELLLWSNPNKLQPINTPTPPHTLSLTHTHTHSRLELLLFSLGDSGTGVSDPVLTDVTAGSAEVAQRATKKNPQGLKVSNTGFNYWFPSVPSSVSLQGGARLSSINATTPSACEL